MALSPELIQQIAHQLQASSVDDRRAAELAAEVARLNDAVLDACGEIQLDDEPSAFSALLARSGR